MINKANEWINLELGNVNNSELTENQLCHYFIACQQEWIELYDNKLSNCNYNSYAVRAGLLEEHPEEIYDLEHYDPINKMELFEYGRGYSKKGYFEMCRQCGGYWGINRRRVSVADRKRSKAYTAEDPDAISYYGRTKALGEIIDGRNLTIRTSIVGSELKNGGIGLFH